MLSSGFFSNSFLYTLFIRGYCEKEIVEEALNLMAEMVNLGLKPHDETYNPLVVRCDKVGALVESFGLCDEMISRGLFPNTSALSFRKYEEGLRCLTVLLEKGSLPDETRFLYLILGYGGGSTPGLIICNSFIRILFECRKLDEAHEYLAIMKRSLGRTICIFELPITAHLVNGNEERAQHPYNEVFQKGLIPNHSITLDL